MKEMAASPSLALLAKSHSSHDSYTPTKGGHVEPSQLETVGGGRFWGDSQVLGGHDGVHIVLTGPYMVHILALRCAFLTNFSKCTDIWNPDSYPCGYP